MKVCEKCNRFNPDDAKTCVECGEDKFQDIAFPFYDGIEPYLEEEWATEHTQP